MEWPEYRHFDSLPETSVVEQGEREKERERENTKNERWEKGEREEEKKESIISHTKSFLGV